MDTRELTITVTKVRYINTESRYAVFQADIMKEKRDGSFALTKNVQTFTGHLFAVNAGDRMEVEAKQVESIVHGKQWEIITCKRCEPGTLEEIRAYLCNFKGLGKARVQKLLDKYGFDTLKKIRESETTLTEFGVPAPVAAKVREDLFGSAAFEQLLTFFRQNEMDYRYAMPIYKKYGERGIERIKSDPYSLYWDGIIDFRTADKLAFLMKKEAAAKERVEAAMLATLRADARMNGNLFVPYAELGTLMTAFFERQKSGFEAITLSQEQMSDALERLVRDEFVIMDAEVRKGEKQLYLRRNYWAETEIRKDLDKLECGIKRYSYSGSKIDDAVAKYEEQTQTALAEEQKSAVRESLMSHISIITGGPGVGKTQTLNAIVSTIKMLSPKAVIKLCAPTGKAALRVADLTGMEATTIHRLLKIAPFMPPIGTDELDCDYLIVDEFSMVDCYLCAELLRAAAPWVRVIIVGDHEQLPSVGPGLVLRDMIASGKIPTTRLEKVYRQGNESAIIRNAHEIIRPHQQGENYKLKINKQPGGQFYFVEKAGAGEVQDTICQSVKRLIQKNGYKLDDVKVLTPRHATDLGTNMLNARLQRAFNPAGEVYEREDGQELRVGDPVVHTKNDYDLSVYNGETGVVKALGYDEEKAVMVEYPCGRHVWYNEMQAEELETAYAMTAHKAQGSEFRVVVLPVHDVLMRGLDRNVLYTAITRAKEMVIVVGTKSAFSAALQKTAVSERNSNLAERLQHEYKTVVVKNVTEGMYDGVDDWI